jgi:hypothetical protein
MKVELRYEDQKPVSATVTRNGGSTYTIPIQQKLGEWVPDLRGIPFEGGMLMRLQLAIAAAIIGV